MNGTSSDFAGSGNRLPSQTICNIVAVPKNALFCYYSLDFYEVFFIKSEVVSMLV